MFTARWLEALALDVRYAARMLWRSPAFTAAATLSLALGIGATTMMFSVIHAVVLEPFPYKDPDTLLGVIARAPKGGLGSYYQLDDFAEIARRSDAVFDGVIASTITDVLMVGQGEPERLRGNYVTMNTFDVMGVPPLIGRGSTADDARPGAPPVAVLGYTFWQRRWGGRPDILGKTLQLDGVARTIVGVMPKRFMWRGADVYLPVVIQAGHPIDGVPAVHLMGRLAAGVTRAQAEAALRPVLADIWRRHPDLDPRTAFTIELPSFKESFASGLRDALFILLGAVSLLLLIACANVSNLLLARAGAREREIAIRTSLGAGRARLIRQLLTESLVLAAGGALLGVLFAHLGLAGILQIIPPDYVPSEADIALNRPVLAATVLLALASAVLFGLAPALQTARRDVMNPLRETGRGVAGGRRQARLRGALVVIEVALAVVLLVGSSLLMRTLINLRAIDTQVQPERLLTVRVPLPPQRYRTADARARFFDELVERVGRLPGVESAAASSGLPLYGSRSTAVTLAGQPPSDIRTYATGVTASYFRVVGLRAVKGRLLSADDVTGRRAVGVINDTFARRFFGADEPIGRIVRLDLLARARAAERDAARALAAAAGGGGAASSGAAGVSATANGAAGTASGSSPGTGTGPGAATAGGASAASARPEDAVEVIGVVPDQLNANLDDPARPEIFMPHALTGQGTSLIVRATLPPLQLDRAIRHEVHAMDKEQPVTDVRTLDALMQEWTFALPRFNLLLLMLFAGLGLALAAIGIYGVIAYAVARQTQEIGIRLALGAQRADVLRMVLVSGLRLVAIGLVIGCFGAAAAMRLLASQLWGVTTYDPLSFGVVILLLLFVGLQACLWPARRAARVDPMIALRYE